MQNSYVIYVNMASGKTIRTISAVMHVVAKFQGKIRVLRYSQLLISRRYFVLQALNDRPFLKIAYGWG